LAFESKFEAEHGRKPEKEEKRPILAELREYKQLKSQLAAKQAFVSSDTPVTQDSAFTVSEHVADTTSAPRVQSNEPTQVSNTANSQEAEAEPPSKPLQQPRHDSLSVSMDGPQDALSNSMNETLPPFVFETALQWATSQLSKWRTQHNIPTEIQVLLTRLCSSSSSRLEHDS
jgi:hypothetical protein